MAYPGILDGFTIQQEAEYDSILTPGPYPIRHTAQAVYRDSVRHPDLIDIFCRQLA
jgi:hypothetical protein